MHQVDNKVLMVIIYMSSRYGLFLRTIIVIFFAL